MTDQSEHLAQLHHAAFEFPRPWSADEFRALLGQTGVFVLQRNGAFVMGRSVAGETELLSIATHPDHRRQGLAQALLIAFDEKARSDASTTIFLEVAAQNTSARALYKKHGFAQVGQRRNYYQHPDGSRQDALVLSKKLIQER